MLGPKLGTGRENNCTVVVQNAVVNDGFVKVTKVKGHSGVNSFGLK